MRELRERRENRAKGVSLRPAWVIRGFQESPSGTVELRTLFDLPAGHADSPVRALAAAAAQYPEKMDALEDGYWRAFPIVRRRGEVPAA